MPPTVRFSVLVSIRCRMLSALTVSPVKGLARQELVDACPLISPIAITQLHFGSI